MIKPASIRKVSRRLEKRIQKEAAAIEKGTVRALNKSLTSVRKIASQEVRQTLNVKAAFVKRLLRGRRASRGRRSMAVQGVYEPIPVGRYSGFRQTKKGVSVRMRKDKPRMLYKGAFVATMPTGHKGVFWRSKNASHRTRGRPSTSSPNLKIREILGPSVQGVFADKLPALQKQADPIVDKNLQREIDYALSKV